VGQELLIDLAQYAGLLLGFSRGGLTRALAFLPLDVPLRKCPFAAPSCLHEEDLDLISLDPIGDGSSDFRSRFTDLAIHVRSLSEVHPVSHSVGHNIRGQNLFDWKGTAGMDFQEIEYEIVDRLLTITLNRPDRLNAFTPRMGSELIEAFDRADADDDVRAIIVTGAGRGFCAGADLGGGGDTFDWRERQTADEIPRDGGGRVALRIFDLTKPVIAAINGPAVGVGITMTLPMDIRLVAEGAKIGFVFTRRGIVQEACSSWFLPRIVGIGQAMEWVASGRVFSAEEALAGGLVRSVHPEGELLDAALALGHEISEHTAPVSVAMARRLLWTMLGAEHPMDAHRADSRAMFARGQSGDAREGVTSFLEKRPAEFSDRVSDGLPELFPGREQPAYS
jgi:enoyl-CoA hydratase/carnithine racemase